MKSKKNIYYSFVYVISERLIFILFILFLLFASQNYELAHKSAIVIFLSFAISEAIKTIYPKRRPQNPLLPKKTDTSFPSSHSAISFALAFSYIFLHGMNVYGFLLFTVASFVALGRVLAGAHFIVDVVVGSLIALGVCLVVYSLNIAISFNL